MIRKLAHATLALGLVIGSAAACSHTASGVVQDTKNNTNAVKSGAQTADVKTAIIADKTIDSGAIDVDTYADKKLVVIRGSVPTEAQKTKATEIAHKHAEGYKIDNQLAVVPKN
jgi:osmotically-inducible protein OsmY